MKTCENCDFSVQFDRSISRRSLGNLGCGFLNAVLKVNREVPQIEPDHTCHYWLNVEEYKEKEPDLIHPWGAE